MSRPSRKINRAALVDDNFTAFVQCFDGADSTSRLAESGLEPETFRQLFESQMLSRQLDLMARRLRLENKVFYTIGSSGHEGNVLLGNLTRHTDPAFLHYRSGALVLERSRQLASIDPVYDIALSFAASSEDPASGGRHKVWGSRPLWILPQTSTIASHVPKALGAALAIDHAGRVNLPLEVPSDAVIVCSFGDASLNHSTCQGALNAAQWATHQGIPVPVLFVCEDNGLGISVRTPPKWVAQCMQGRFGMDYREANGLDLAEGYPVVKRAVESCREHRRPVFLHLSTVRLMGHAGTDFEIDYRSETELADSEAQDPLLVSAALAMSEGLMSADEVLQAYEAARERCDEAAARADQRPKLGSAAEVMAPLAPTHQQAIEREAARCDDAARMAAFGGSDQLPEKGDPRNLAGSINQALFDLLGKYPQALVFGEDVAQKGGVYTVTRGLHKRFGATRVFNTLLDEQTILGLAQGYGTFGFLPIPEIQYLAYYHNACDQLRGEAASMQFFSDGRFANPMVLRVAGLGYQKGFGGHFHNDNSVTALRDIPGLIMACPSRGDDAAAMLRTLCAAAVSCGRVCVFLEPIALYMTRDLYEEGDGAWLFPYPAPDEVIALGEPRIYDPFAADLLIITYGNGVPMSLRVARELKQARDVAVRVMDLRWLAPLNAQAIVEQASQCERVLVVDEGRHSGGIAEGVITALVEGAVGAPVRRVCGQDSYTPLGPAAGTVLPDDAQILDAAFTLLDT